MTWGKLLNLIFLICKMGTARAPALRLLGCEPGVWEAANAVAGAQAWPARPAAPRLGSLGPQPQLFSSSTRSLEMQIKSITPEENAAVVYLVVSRKSSLRLSPPLPSPLSLAPLASSAAGSCFGCSLRLEHPSLTLKVQPAQTSPPQRSHPLPS